MRLFRARANRYEDQLDAELRFHLEQQIADYIREGLTAREARRRALIEFGGPTQIKEECREVRRLNPMADLTQDVRYALRMIRKRPGFAAVAITALALGIGANAAVFSIVNALLLRPVTFPDLDRLVSVRAADSRRPNVGLMVNPADFLDFRERNKAFQRLTAWTYHDYDYTSDRSDPEGFRGAQVTADFLDTLGASPALGRGFQPGEDEAGRHQVVLLSDALWRQRFGGDASIVGRSILLDSKSFVVIGVMPKGFEFPMTSVSLWCPLVLDRAARTDRRPQNLEVGGRLKDGVSLDYVRAEMKAQAQRLEREYPDTNRNRTASVVLLRERQGEFSKPFLTLLQGTALFVLLIACANLANLQMAHTFARQREISVRAALGAGRWRVIRLLVIESLAIAMAGGAAGIAVGSWGVSFLKASVPADSTRFVTGWNQIGIEPSVLLFTLFIAIASGLLFGLTAAWKASNHLACADHRHNGHHDFGDNERRAHM